MVIQIQKHILVQLFVRGEPVAQTRARHGAHNVYSDATEALKRWKGQIGQAMRRAQRQLNLEAFAGALAVDMVFMIPTKQKERWGELCVVKPDKDNLEKAVLDVMGDCQMFAVGDQQVAAGEVQKVWCRVGDEGVLVVVSKAKATKNPSSSGEQAGVMDWLAKD